MIVPKSMTLLFLCLCSVAVFAESAAGLRWNASAGWVSQGERPMRAATYTIAPAAGDRAAAECAMFFFGAGQGGSVAANLERWKGQFTDPAGRPAVAAVATRTVRGLPITTIAASGDYSGLGGPMAAASPPAAGYRLLGAIVEGPGGNVFIKFTGPAKTIAANQAKFEQLLASFQRDH